MVRDAPDLFKIKLLHHGAIISEKRRVALLKETIVKRGPSQPEGPFEGDFVLEDASGHEKFIKGKVISSGAYGDVYIYESNITHKKIAVKHFKEHFDGEMLLLSLWELNGDIHKFMECGLVNARALGGRVIMNLMDGNLNDLVHSLNLNEGMVKEVIRQLTVGAICLKEKGYKYADYKAVNILYEKDGDGFKLYYGDLGSIDILGGEDAVATFPPYESFDEWPSDDPEMVWGIAMTVIDMLSNKYENLYDYLMNLFGYDNLGDVDVKYLNKMVDEIKDEPQIRDLLKKMLPRDRITLEELLKEVN